LSVSIDTAIDANIDAKPYAYDNSLSFVLDVPNSTKRCNTVFVDLGD